MLSPARQFCFEFNCAELIETAGAPVVVLRFAVRPSNVGRSIVPIIIDAVQRKARRAFADIAKKIYEVFPPRVNFYATTAIVFISCIVGVVAAVAHAAPDSIQGMPLSRSAGISVFETGDVTPARTDIAGSEMLSSNNVGVSAVTLTQPSPLFPNFIKLVQGDQFTEALIGNVPAIPAYTTARLSVTVSEIGANREGRLPAIALAQPTPSSTSYAANLVNLVEGDESAKPLACDIYCCAHGTASNGSMGSDGVGALTLAPLRIVAQK